jgi:predicted transcriptional regulator
MKKTMIYLEDDQYLLLKKIASSSNRRMTEIIREALARHLRTRRVRKADALSFIGIAKGPKKGNTSERAEEILRESLR